MLFMLIVNASQNSEEGKLPSLELREAMRMPDPKIPPS